MNYKKQKNKLLKDTEELIELELLRVQTQNMKEEMELGFGA